jgi:hypothetical protein
LHSVDGGQIAKLTAAFSRASAEDRAEMFSKCLVRAAEGDRDAEAILTNIKAIWFAQRFTLKAFVSELSPDPGLLRALGYRVGATGQPTQIRHLILNYLWTSDDLPPIRDEHYMQQWGAPMSRLRATKFITVLRNLISDKRYDARYDLAVSEWLADLEYVEVAWGQHL